MATREPRVLRCPDIGIIIEYEVGRVWSKIIARKASRVYLTRVRTAELDLCAGDFEYQKGIAEAARRFRYPITGPATVTPEAAIILESIMTTYAINTASSTIVGRFTSAEEAATIVGENPTVQLVATAEEAAEKLTLKQMADIVTAETGSHVGRYRNKQAGAAAVLAAADAKVFAAETGSKKRISVKDRLRETFADADTSVLFDNLLDAYGCTPAALSTALSDLKNEKYAAGPVLVLVRDKTTNMMGRK